MNKKLVIALCLPLLLTGCWKTSEGQKIGMVVKAARAGVFWRTKEIEMIRLSAKGPMVATGFTPFDCSVENEVVFKKLESLLSQDTQITVKYHTEISIAPWRGDTNCLIDEVIEGE